MISSVLKAGLAYFGLAFGAGFLLGIPRVLWLAPRIGIRAAELIEAPIMLVVTILSARWVVARYSIPPLAPARLGTGLLGLLLLAGTEFSFVLWLRGLTIQEYVNGRDPVAGSVYCALLILFALMPVLVARDSSRPKHY